MEDYMMEEYTMEDYETQRKVLRRLMDEYTREDVAVAFSGGADSSLLLKLAALCAGEKGRQVFAITAATDLHPAADEKIAERVAVETGARHMVLRIRELEQGDIRHNPVDRCYRCKKYLFQQIKDMAEKAGAPVVLEGTNTDDLTQYRPGLRAIEELGIKSPLKEAGFTKAQVRRLAKEHGISVADRPSSPCLATRFPYGAELTVEKLKQAEGGEEYLRTLGLYNVRLRVHGDIARIEADREALGTVAERREEVVRHLKDLGYRYITLDLEGFRSGSMDEGLELGKEKRL